MRSINLQKVFARSTLTIFVIVALGALGYALTRALRHDRQSLLLFFLVGALVGLRLGLGIRRILKPKPDPGSGKTAAKVEKYNLFGGDS